MDRSRSLASLLLVLALVVMVLTALLLTGCRETEEKSGGKANKQSTSPVNGSSASNVQSTAGSRAQSSQPGAEESTVIIATAKASAVANNPDLGELEVFALKVVGDWARVDMQPVSRSTDMAIWLLKKEEDTWQVVDFGTSILPSDHPDAPAEVFR